MAFKKFLILKVKAAFGEVRKKPNVFGQEVHTHTMQGATFELHKCTHCAQDYPLQKGTGPAPDALCMAPPI